MPRYLPRTIITLVGVPGDARVSRIDLALYLGNLSPGQMRGLEEAGLLTPLRSSPRSPQVYYEVREARAVQKAYPMPPASHVGLPLRRKRAELRQPTDGSPSPTSSASPSPSRRRFRLEG